MPKVFGKMLFLLLLATGMTWAANETAAAVQSEQVIKQRALERWDALIKRDYTVAYSFEHPAYRAAYSLEQYRKEFGEDIAWDKVEINQLVFEGNEVATVFLKVWYRSLQPDWARTSQIGGNISEKWIWEDNQWWHVTKPSWLEPVGRLK